MRILFDHGTPAPLQSFLTGHSVREAKAQGWDTFKNGDLVAGARVCGAPPPRSSRFSALVVKNPTRLVTPGRVAV